jgi:DNA-directed RNA polymerase subunit K/omega
MADALDEDYEIEEDVPESDAESSDDSSDDSSDESAGEGDAAQHDPVLDDARSAVVIYRVPPEERVTSDRLQRIEFAALLAERSRQIDSGGQVFCELRDHCDSQSLALQEILDRKCPLLVCRVLRVDKGVQYVEEWSPNELIFPPDVRMYFRPAGSCV